MLVTADQGFIQPFVSGGSMKLSGGTIEWPKATSRGARREAPSEEGVWGGGVPLSRNGGPGVSTPGKF